jgi:hypothetical protein
LFNGQHVETFRLRIYRTLSAFFARSDRGFSDTLAFAITDFEIPSLRAAALVERWATESRA